MQTLERRHELITELLVLIQAGKETFPADIDQFVAADWSLALESTPTPLRQKMWQIVPTQLRSEALSAMREETRHELLKGFEHQEILETAQQATKDQALNVLIDLPGNTLNAVIAEIEHTDEASSIKAAMEYAADNVGRHADRNYITLSAVLKVSEAKAALIAADSELHQHFVFATDPRGKFVGKVKVASLWQQPEDAVLSDLVCNGDQFILDTESTNKLGTIFRRFDASQLPVVDVEGRIIGVFDAQDAIAHLESHYQTEFAHAGNVNDEDLFGPVRSSAKQRAIWLGINLLTAILAAQVIGLFESTLDAIVALAVLMPIVASMGGIAGSQTLTLTIRGLATNQLSDANISLLRNKEFQVALINSVIWAATVAVIAYFWFDNTMLSLILGIAVIVNMVVTVLFGIAIPYIMHKLKIDPALAGSVVLTTISDVVGFFVFLGLATLWLL